MAAGFEPMNSILHCTVEILFRNRCAFKSKAQLIFDISQIMVSCKLAQIKLSFSKKLSHVNNIFATFVHHCTTFATGFVQWCVPINAKDFFETKNGCRERFIQLYLHRQDDNLINRAPSTANGASGPGC